MNLKDLQGSLSKKGKPPYQDKALAADILSLDPNDANDAFVWSKAAVVLTGDPKKDNANKMLWRQRAISVAKATGIVIRIQWTNNGEMVISRKG